MSLEMKVRVGFCFKRFVYFFFLGGGEGGRGGLSG